MKTFLGRLRASQRGATAVEYGLIISMIVVAMTTALSSLADKTTGIWNDVAVTVVSTS